MTQQDNTVKIEERTVMKKKFDAIEQNITYAQDITGILRSFLGYALSEDKVQISSKELGNIVGSLMMVENYLQTAYDDNDELAGYSRQNNIID